MSYMNRTIQTTTNELNFIKTFINNVTADCPHITCDTSTLEAQFAGQFAGTGGKPAFILNILDEFPLRMERAAVLESNTYGYNITFTNSAGISETFGTLQFVNYDLPCTTISRRLWSYEICYGNGAVNLLLKDCNSAVKAEICTLKNEEISAAAFSNSSLIRACENQFTFSNGTTANLHNRFTYRNDDLRKIEILKNKVFKTADGATISEKTSVLYDCSYVPANEIITADGNSYVSLGNYTLIGG